MVYKVLGLMSGTSLDGLDLAYVEFFEQQGQWSFELHHSTTLRYSDEWYADLRNAQSLPKSELQKLHVDYGAYLGLSCNKFIEQYQVRPELIASHGHTVFHQPENRYTCQLGDGRALAQTSGIQTVYDFRTLDVSLGGQGAPLVPVGDRMLFSKYDVCLNLGGFANVSFESGGSRIAFDVAPVNIALNVMANALGKEYDHNGSLAATGNTDGQLLEKLNALPYYHEPAPKSLSREWHDEQFMPVVRKAGQSNEDMLATICEHIAKQVQRSTVDLGIAPGARLLVTGGGALNGFLVDCIRRETQLEVTIPDKSIIEFKEALIFAFLGVLRMRGDINCLSSVTGANRDSSCGVIVRP